jgi:hypothetical protein
VRPIVAVAIITVILASRASRGDDGAIQVRPLGVFERRFHSRVDEGNGVRLPLPGVTSVTIELTGRPMRRATRYSRIRFDAFDENGKVIRQYPHPDEAGRPPGATDWRRFCGYDPPKDRVMLDLDMDSPDRRTTKISSLRGSVTFLVGQLEDLDVRDFARKVGQPIERRELQEAGLSVTLEGLDPAGSAQVDISGRGELVERVEFVDAAGVPLSPFRGSYFSTYSDSPTRRFLRWAGPLPPGASLRITLLKRPSELIVPISLRDIPLP